MRKFIYPMMLLPLLSIEAGPKKGYMESIGSSLKANYNKACAAFENFKNPEKCRTDVQKVVRTLYGMITTYCKLTAGATQKYCLQEFLKATQSGENDQQLEEISGLLGGHEKVFLTAVASNLLGKKNYSDQESIPFTNTDGRIYTASISKIKELIQLVVFPTANSDTGFHIFPEALSGTVYQNWLAEVKYIDVRQQVQHSQSPKEEAHLKKQLQEIEAEKAALEAQLHQEKNSLEEKLSALQEQLEKTKSDDKAQKLEAQVTTLMQQIEMLKRSQATSQNTSSPPLPPAVPPAPTSFAPPPPPPPPPAGPLVKDNNLSKILSERRKGKSPATGASKKGDESRGNLVEELKKRGNKGLKSTGKLAELLSDKKPKKKKPSNPMEAALAKRFSAANSQDSSDNEADSDWERDNDE